MPKFWSFVGNEKYDVGLTGQTVYVYDKKGNELARFKDLIYAYACAISPKGDIFVVKSTEGRMAVYSFESLSLIKKFRFSKIDGGQDDGYCFSVDGKYFYNIERHIDGCQSALSVYNTADFLLEKRLFLNDINLNITSIEYDKNADNYFILGFLRNPESRVAEKFFVAKLLEDRLEETRYIPVNVYRFYQSAKSLELSGFTEKAYEWSAIKNFQGDLSPNALEHLKNRDNALFSLWKNNESIVI